MSRRAYQAFRKMGAGTIGGQSRVATPVAPGVDRGVVVPSEGCTTTIGVATAESLTPVTNLTLEYPPNAAGDVSIIFTQNSGGNEMVETNTTRGGVMYGFPNAGVWQPGFGFGTGGALVGWGAQWLNPCIGSDTFLNYSAFVQGFPITFTGGIILVNVSCVEYPFLRSEAFDEDPDLDDVGPIGSGAGVTSDTISIPNAYPLTFIAFSHTTSTIPVLTTGDWTLHATVRTGTASWMTVYSAEGFTGSVTATVSAGRFEWGRHSFPMPST